MSHRSKLPRPDLSVDAVTASVDTPVERLIELFGNILETEARPGRPLNGYDHAVQLVDRQTERDIALVQTGSRYPKPGIHAQGTETADAPSVHGLLSRHLTGLWLPSRLDVAADWDDPESFERCNAILVQYALDHNIKLSQLGDWTRGKGRTRYLYSNASRIYLRLYEYRQWHGYGPETRLELQMQFKGHEQRSLLAATEPWRALFMCPAVVHLLTELGLGDTPLIRVTPGPRSPSSIERDVAFLASTAWPAISRLLSHHHGDPAAVVYHVADHRADLSMQAEALRNARRDTYKAPLTPASHGVTLQPD